MSQDQFAADLARELRMFYGLHLTPDQARALIESSPDLKGSIEEMGEVATAERELAAQLLAQQVLSEDWPTGLTHTEGERLSFFHRLAEAAPQHGYCLTTPDFWEVQR